MTIFFTNSCGDGGKEEGQANYEQLKKNVEVSQTGVNEAKQRVSEEEQKVQNSPSNEQAQRDLEEARRILLEKEQELQAAQRALEEAGKPVACAKQVSEEEYPCSKVCADINKAHEVFQRYFYCMESNAYAHNVGAKSCFDTYVAN